MRKPKIKTYFIIYHIGKQSIVPKDAEVRRWIYHNGKRGTQYFVDEIDEHGVIQNSYSYKFSTEGPIFRKQIYSKWKQEIQTAKTKQKELFFDWSEL